MSGCRSAAILTALSLLSACMTDDQNATRLQGAGAGAAVGAGLGALIGGDPEDALIGAAAGGLVGLAAGDAVARSKATYASEEEMLVQERRIVASKADQIGAYNADLQRQLDRLNLDIAALEAAAAEGRDEHWERLNLRKSAKANLDLAQQRLAEVNQEIDVSREIYQEAEGKSEPVDLAEWDRRIRELERRRDALAALIRDFENSRQRIV